MGVLFSIDAHAGGGPCRVVHAGIPRLPGPDARANRDYFRENFDWIRMSLMHEPRGHEGMFGALLLAPVGRTSEFSLIFFDPAGYLDSCGHGTLCSIAVWRRMMGELEVPFGIDNPDGTVTTVLSAVGDDVQCEATIQMAAAIVRQDIELGLRDGIKADLVRCGNTFVLVDADELTARGDQWSSLDGRREQILSEILRAARTVSNVERSRTLEVLVYKRLGGNRFETAILYNGTQIDRSPCGTGSGALGCLLLRRGEIGWGDEIVTYGSMNLPFYAVAVPGEASTLQIQLSGTAYITGVHEWLLSSEDPLRAGKTLGGIAELAGRSTLLEN